MITVILTALEYTVIISFFCYYYYEYKYSHPNDPEYKRLTRINNRIFWISFWCTILLSGITNNKLYTISQK